MRITSMDMSESLAFIIRMPACCKVLFHKPEQWYCINAKKHCRDGVTTGLAIRCAIETFIDNMEE